MFMYESYADGWPLFVCFVTEHINIYCETAILALGYLYFKTYTNVTTDYYYYYY